MGAHCRASDMNRLALGVCMEGNMDWQQVGSDQRSATVELITQLCQRYGIDSGNVIGHREAGSSKTCPGTNVQMKHYRELIRTEVQVTSE